MILLGRRQTASQEILDLPCGGSNPPAPAIIKREVRSDRDDDIVFVLLPIYNEGVRCRRV